GSQALDPNRIGDLYCTEGQVDRDDRYGREDRRGKHDGVDAGAAVGQLDGLAQAQIPDARVSVVFIDRIVDHQRMRGDSLQFEGPDVGRVIDVGDVGVINGAEKRGAALIVGRSA